MNGGGRRMFVVAGWGGTAWAILMEDMMLFYFC
jgi:hypothetical protein